MGLQKVILVDDSQWVLTFIDGNGYGDDGRKR
jgi:hypothetical protein